METKYYHLYQGLIPFPSIEETKVLFRKTDESRVLGVVQIGDPCLRQKARELSKEEILSPEIQELIEQMKKTMREAPGVGLAAPQVGCSIQLFVVEDRDHSHLTSEGLLEHDRKPVPFHVVINPRLSIEDFEEAEFFEGCLSIPSLTGVVPRAKAVRVECLNERAESVVIHAKGWYARILQHEVDHLQGTLFVDRVLLETLAARE